MRNLKGFETLKTNREFQATYRGAKKWHTDFFVVFFMPQEVKMVGFTATKKVGNSVKRSRAKRLLRALFIEFTEKMKSGIYIFVAKDSILQTQYTNLENTFVKSLRKLKAYNE